MHNLCIEQLVYSPLSVYRVEILLNSLNLLFYPPLSKRVTFLDYSEKVTSKGIVLIANCAKQDVGMISFYANDVEHKEAYISLLGVLPNYHNIGLGYTLLKKSIFLAKSKGMNCVTLKVDKINKRALDFYNKHGFIQKSTSDEKITMELFL